MDWYLGIKPVTGRITWDLGVIYYTYPNALQSRACNVNYLELKVGASTEIWKDGTVGVTVFYSPEYQYESGQRWTIETQLHAGLPEVQALHREWTPTFSALLGWQAMKGQDAATFNVRQRRRQLPLLERRPHARLPREVVDRLPLLGHQYEQGWRLRLLQGRPSSATSGSWGR